MTEVPDPAMRQRVPSHSTGALKMPLDYSRGSIRRVDCSKKT